MILKLNLKSQLHFMAFFLMLTIITIACRKKDVIAEKPGEILSFKLEAAYNRGLLTSDIEAVIKDKSITLNLPKGIDLKNIVASFTFSGKIVQVNGIKQESATNRNNFENALTYVVLGDNGTPTNYTIVVTQFDDLELTFSAFNVEKKYNTQLSKDYTFSFTDNTIAGSIASPGTKLLIPSFTTNAKEVLINGIKQESTKTLVDFSNPVTYTVVSSTGFKKNYIVNIDWNYSIPNIYITTDNNVPIVSKDDYVTATIKIEGNGVYNDYTGTTKIKGRGNSTWGYPKKPYRLKLDKKTSLFGLLESKNWVLLANYLDGTLMLNSIALKTGKLLNLPYTNNAIPVNITLNGKYVGSYLFTEQVEVDVNRVNIADGGTLLELDKYFDEPYEFRSNNYNLPVMVKYPELTDQTQLVPIKDQFHQLENLVAASNFPNNDYLQYIDAESLVNFLIVFNLTDNEEINHPKSIYIYKPKNGKFTLGPLWDFDWAYGYEERNVYFTGATRPLFWSTNPASTVGTQFFSRFMLDPTIKALYKQKWAEFKTNKLPILLQYVDEYANLIEASKKTDYTLWSTGSGNFRNDVSKLRTWLQNRASYIDSYVAGL